MENSASLSRELFEKYEQLKDYLKSLKNVAVAWY